MGHRVDNICVLLVGSSSNVILVRADDTGILVSVQGSGGSVELRFFPWASVVTISTTAG